MLRISLLTSFLFLIFNGLLAQDDKAQASAQAMLPEVKDMDLLSTWKTGNVGFNDIWGYVDSQGKEVAIMGSRTHYYFVDISNPSNPQMINGFAGGSNTTWRDMKTYGQWAYGVCDRCSEGLSIFKMGDSPASNGVSLVTQNTSYFTAAHNIFIDEQHGRLYVIGSNTQAGGVIIFDIKTNPEVPTLLASVNLAGGYMHDLYVRNHIGYANSANRGLYVYNFSTPTNPQTLGSMTSYPQQGYNHAGWLNPAGDVLIMADETHNTSLKAVNVSDLSDIEVTSLFRSELLAPAATGSIAHNPFVRDNYAVVSYYHDGVQIFDISNPANVQQVAWYDTFTSNTGYGGYSGCWGVYPYLPSGNIIGSDGTNGLFVLKATDITFNPIPPVQPPFAFLNEDISPCVAQGDPVSMSLNTDADVIQWYRNGNQVGFSNSYTATSEGSYTAIVYKGPHSLIVGPIEISYGIPPDVSLNVPTQNDICEGENLEIIVTAGADSYEWFLDGTSIGMNTNSISVAEPGMYMVNAIKDGCEATSNTVNLSTQEYPSAELNVTGAQVLCETESLLIETSVIADSYVWRLDSEVLDGANTNQLSTTLAGFYTLEIANGNCSSLSEIIPVEFVSEPIIDLNATGDVSACEGEFFLLETSTMANTYEWMLDGVLLQDGDEASLLATESGTYQLTVTTDYCTTTSEEINVTITNIPSSSINPQGPSNLCDGETNVLTSAFQYDTYQWFLDGQAIPGATQETYEANQSGNYTLEVGDNNCIALSGAYTIEVNQTPQISLATANAVSICDGETTTLNVIGEANAFRWTLDGMLLGNNNNFLEVSEAGVYTVTAFNSNCFAEPLSVSVEVLAYPTLDIEVSDAVLCGGETSILTASSNSNDFIWLRNGELIAENTNSISVDLPGAYTIQTEGAPCFATSATYVISAGEQPNASLPNLINPNLCQGELYSIEAQAGYANYTWFQNGNPLQENSNELIVDASGNYSVQITSTDGCFAESEIQSISFNALPNAELNTASQQSICAGSSIALEAPQTGDTYIWFLDTEPISTEENIEVTQVGVYQLQLTTNGCSSFSQEITVSVTDIPELELIVNIVICEGDTYTTNLDLDYDSYQWYLDGDPFSTDMNIEISQGGSYYLEVTSGNCIGASTVQNVDLFPIPDATVNVEGGLAICEGESTVLMTNEDASSYTWYLDGEEINTSESSLEVTESGSYTVVVEQGGCINESSAIDIQVDQAESVMIDGNEEQFICIGESSTLTATSAATELVWYLDGEEIFRGEDSEIEITEVGEYTVEAIQGACIENSNAVTVSLTDLTDAILELPDAEICEGDELVLETGLVSASHFWFKDEDLFTTGPTLTTTEPGAYYLLTRKGLCEVTTNTFQVSVIQLPGFNNNDYEDITLCEEEVYTLTVPNGVEEFVWYKDGAEINSTDETLNISEAGTYQLEISEGSCVERSNELTVSIYELPSLDYLANDIELCADEVAMLQAPADMDNYRWIRDGNIIVTATGDVFETAQAGTYQLEIVKDGCAKLSAEFTIEVIELESIEVSSGINILCGETASVLIPVENLDYDSIFLTLEGEIIDSSTEEFIIIQSGSYTIIGKTGNCTTESNIFGYEFNDNPEITPVASQVFACPGETGSLEILGGGNLDYSWTYENGTPAGNEIAIDVNTPGIYTITVTDPATGCSSDAEIEFINYEVTVPSVDVSTNLLTSSTSESYQWYLDGDLISDATEATYEATANGNYLVATTDANGCITFSEEVFVELTAIDKIQDLQRFDLYPNPVQDQLTLSLSTSRAMDLDITIHNQLGQSLWTSSIQQQGTQVHRIPVETLTQGLYYISLRNAEGDMETLKFTKLN